MRSRTKGSLLLAAALAATLSACTATDAAEDKPKPDATSTATEAAKPSTAVDTTEPEEVVPTQEPEEVGALDLEVGDCLLYESLEGDQVSETTAVDCATEHDAEIFAALEHADGDYPGEEAIAAEGEAFCVEEFESFVGEPYATSKYYMTSLYPTSGSWKFADDRITLCIILAGDMVTGSLEGANA